MYRLALTLSYILALVLIVNVARFLGGEPYALAALCGVVGAEAARRDSR
jgi:hypothetical protein